MRNALAPWLTLVTITAVTITVAAVAIPGLHAPGAAAHPVRLVAARLVADAPDRLTRELAGSDAVERRLASATAMARAEAERAAQARAQAEQAAQAAQAVRANAVRPPAAAVAVPAPVAASGAVPDMIRQAFAPQGQGAVDWALRVARCESGYNPGAYNASSGASGVFQFLPSTWRGSPYAGSSPMDAWANVQAAAWLYGRSGPGQWMCR